jgi:hypothetical protein
MAQGSKNKTYEFTLILSGAAEVTDETANAIYEAGLSDALFGSREGVLYLDVAREASSREEAIRSAKADVERAGLGLKVSRVQTSTD